MTANEFKTYIVIRCINWLGYNLFCVVEKGILVINNF